MELNELAHDREPDPAAGHRFGMMVVEANERTPDLVAAVGGYARALVFDHDTRPVAGTLDDDRDGLALRAVPNGVVEQVEQHAPHRVGVDARAHLLALPERHAHAAALGDRRERVDRFG